MSFSTLEAAAARWRDMEPHLATLTRLASGSCRALELGVRGGVSTWALLDGLPDGATLTSVDIDPVCREIVPDRVKHDPRWTLRIGDDRTLPLEGTYDFVFIDTSHEYEHTLLELELADRSGASVIALHDWALEPVERAIRVFMAADPAWSLEIEESQWGFAILTR